MKADADRARQEAAKTKRIAEDQLNEERARLASSETGRIAGALAFGAVGAKGGAALGALGGPAAPVTVPLGGVLGGITFAAVGGVLGEEAGGNIHDFADDLLK